MEKDIISHNSNLLDAIQALENSPRRMIVVCDSSKNLMGSLTDGDIRRCLLKGYNLNSNIMLAANINPIVAKIGTNSEKLYRIIKELNVIAIPIIDENNTFIKLLDKEEIFSKTNNPLPNNNFEFAVIMAGGLGSRLRPLTYRKPKPMIEVGGLPLLERQIRLLHKFGIKKVYLSVNYLSDIICNFFGDGSKFGLSIEYLKEEKACGTAGSLSLLKNHPKNPFLVLNGDILTDFNLKGLYEFHYFNKSELTIASVDYSISVPYGTLNVEGIQLKSLVEKPVIKYLCNAGIYVLDPICLDYIPKDENYNITTLIEQFLEDSKNINVFPIHEYWMDIGNINDLEKARAIFNKK